jgi:hypothetical protein
MSLAQRFSLRNLARWTARLARTRAPGLFHRVSTNRVLRAAYRRLANPALVYSSVYIRRPVYRPTTSTDDSVELLSCLRRELASWNPGKRIDA